MRIATKFGGLIASVALALTMIGVSPAHAAVASTVSIRWNAMDENFHGKVVSGSQDCVAHRTVKVFQKTSTGPKLVGKTTSNKKGYWKVTLMAHSGKYFAKALAGTMMSTNCGAARSTTVDVM